MASPARTQIARPAALLALTIALIAVLIVLLSGRPGYVLHARFANAGQLVSGDLVTVAGHQVGSVGAIKLAPNGLADVELDISDDSITPVHADTIASIGQLSLTGVANRFVALQLSGGGRSLASDSALPATQTRGIVDLDVLLDALTPKVRASLQRLLAGGAYLVGRPTAGQLNAAAAYMNPALSQLATLGGEVVSDRFALQRLVASTAQLTGALAARDGDVAGAVTNTAGVLQELAAQRQALQDTLVRAPGVLAAGGRVLADADRTLRALDPVLGDLRPAAPKLATLLRTLVPVARDAIPTISGVQALVPAAENALVSLPPVERQATPAVRSLAAALKGITPILSGLRPYTPDVVAGFFNGVGGASGGYYDANGHYLKALLTVAGGAGSLTGVLSLLGKATASLGPFNGARSGLTAPCPGGGGPPATDGSNAWTTPDVLPGISQICNPSDDQRP